MTDEQFGVLQRQLSGYFTKLISLAERTAGATERIARAVPDGQGSPEGPGRSEDTGPATR